ncbi:MAG: hypothetical protein WA004_12035 [Saprospiraceae bacterium]
MRKFIGLLAIACMPLFAAAQYSQDFAGCPDASGQTATTTPLFGKSSDDLQAYFSERLQPIIDNQQPKGDLELKVVIDAEGMPCLSSFTLNGEVRIEPNHIKNIVDGMGSWQPARNNDQAVAYQAVILVRFKGTKATAQLLAQ